ncbi:MAG TPA: hypothetical protein VF815_09725, partial [Myxococcaceae bacterium]
MKRRWLGGALALALHGSMAQAQQEPAPDEPAAPPPTEQAFTPLPETAPGAMVVEEVVVLGAEKTLPETVQAYSRLTPGDTVV